MSPQAHQDGDGNRTFTESARREQITDRAIELIAEHGYAKTSLARIAKAAGISNAAVLYHFGSKAAVLESALTTVLGGLIASVGEAMQSATTAAESIEAYIRALVAYVDKHPHHTRIIIEVMTNGDLGDSTQIPGYEQQDTRRWVPLADAMKRAQSEGDYREFEVRTYAIAIGGAIDAIFAESLEDPAYDLDEAVDNLVDFVRQATRKRPQEG